MMGINKVLTLNYQSMCLIVYIVVTEYCVSLHSLHENQCADE